MAGSSTIIIAAAGRAEIETAQDNQRDHDHCKQ